MLRGVAVALVEFTRGVAVALGVEFTRGLAVRVEVLLLLVVRAEAGAGAVCIGKESSPAPLEVVGGGTCPRGVKVERLLAAGCPNLGNP